MSLTTSEMTPADIRACTCNDNGNSGWGGNFGEWILIFLIFAIFGWGGNGFGGFGGNSGAAENYVLASDFSQLSRQLSDGFNSQERKLDSITNGLCDGFYTQAQLVNGVNTNIMQGQFALANEINGVKSAVTDCCCKTQASIADVNYNLATQNCATLTAIDKVGDRIIDYISTEKMQSLRDENQALRLAASQAKQNEYLVSQLGYQCPKPAYVVQPPQNVTFPTNCCGTVNYANGCGCNG